MLKLAMTLAVTLGLAACTLYIGDGDDHPGDDDWPSYPGPQIDASPAQDVDAGPPPGWPDAHPAYPDGDPYDPDASPPGDLDASPGQPDAAGGCDTRTPDAHM
jgi:hypothetical protein